jgi:hypothetical protein
MKNFQLEKDRTYKAPGFAKASDFALWASLSAATQQVELPTPLFELRRDKTTGQDDPAGEEREGFLNESGTPADSALAGVTSKLGRKRGMDSYFKENNWTGSTSLR